MKALFKDFQGSLFLVRQGVVPYDATRPAVSFAKAEAHEAKRPGNAKMAKAVFSIAFNRRLRRPRRRLLLVLPSVFRFACFSILFVLPSVFPLFLVCSPYFGFHV
ncbi:MAG: hypothetical protein MJ202_01880 [Lentisphaeria bacterium]|nr:hypothetical protein [Lentisphaeria bacterium]